MNRPASKSTSQQRRQRYLARVFALNPLVQAPRLLDIRRRALGLQADHQSAASAARPAARATQIARQKVKALQNEFWTLPLDEIERRLETIDTQNAPALAATVRRLGVVAANRPMFAQMVQERRADLPLVRAFKSAVVAATGEAGFAKERFLQSIHQRSRLRNVQRAVRTIRDKYPTLYALERDWFETLLRMKKPAAASVGDETPATQRPFFDLQFSWWWVFPTMFIVRMLLRIMTSEH